MSPYSQKQPVKPYVIVIVSFAVVCIVALGIYFFSRPSRSEILDKTPEDGGSSDLSEQAYITNGELLIDFMGGVTAYELLAQDLRYYAEAAYKDYDESSEIVGFKATYFNENNDTNATMVGEFGSGGDNINVTIDLLNNERIRTAISEEGGLSLSDELPSANSYNSFIASLPITENGVKYLYDVNDITKDIIIVLDRFDRAKVDESTDKIIEVSGDSYDSTRIKYLFKQQ